MAFNGDSIAMGGTTNSCSAIVGHEPIQERHPTQRDSTTIIGLLRIPGGISKAGRSASNGQ